MVKPAAGRRTRCVKLRVVAAARTAVCTVGRPCLHTDLLAYPLASPPRSAPTVRSSTRSAGQALARPQSVPPGLPRATPRPMRRSAVRVPPNAGRSAAPGSVSRWALTTRDTTLPRARLPGSREWAACWQVGRCQGLVWQRGCCTRGWCSLEPRASPGLWHRRGSPLQRYTSARPSHRRFRAMRTHPCQAPVSVACGAAGQVQRQRGAACQALVHVVAQLPASVGVGGAALYAGRACSALQQRRNFKERAARRRAPPPAAARQCKSVTQIALQDGLPHRSG